MERQFHYAALIQSQIYQMFDDESENHVDQKDFADPENIKAFIHALATIVPSTLYNKLTGSDVNNLEFNHIANHVVFDYSIPATTT